LRTHFSMVERELVARDVSRLTASQRSARADLIGLLHRYSAAGTFPRNDFHPGRRVPYFRDAHGNLCAMAFLISATGRGDIVDRIARTRNNAYVAELADEPGLLEWIDQHGITVAEAARIQPTYGGPGFTGEDPKPSTGYVVASAGTTGLSVISIALNARSPDRLSGDPGWGIIGLGVGGASMVLGLVKVTEDGWRNQALGAWNVAVGATAAFFGGRALSKRKVLAQRTADRLRIAPVALTGHHPGIGFVGQLRF
ncbi:MAG TPA: hypothetical protein VF187_00540, partial [Gemmatimonadales bacterium]